MKRATCRTCDFVDIAKPPAKGMRAGAEIEIGTCHGDTIDLTTESAGAFPPVALDIDWCRHHQRFKPPARKD